MNTVKFTTLKEFLRRISTLIPSSAYNERLFTIWAIQGLRLSSLESNLVPKVVCSDFNDHMIPLPDDFIYLHGVGVSPNTPKELSGFIMAKPHTGVFPPYCQDCPVVYRQQGDSIVVNLSRGHYILSYLTYPKTKDGETLVVDDPALTEALTHYVLYNHFLSKSIQGEDVERQRNFHLNMWQTLKVRARNIDLPDLGSLENIRRVWTSLVPKGHDFAKAFSSINDVVTI